MLLDEKKRIMVRHFFLKFCISSTDTFFAYRNVSQSFVINHLYKVVDTFQCVCVLSNFQHLNLHLHVLLTLNFELGQFATLFFGAKNKIVEIDLQLAKEWNYQEYHACKGELEAVFVRLLSITAKMF